MKRRDVRKPTPQGNSKEERMGRIIAASLAVFSEYSFEDATTEEIARRARVSKRDIYAHFPDKHALLIATLNEALQTEVFNIMKTIKRTRRMPSLQKKLETIGLTLVNEILSAAMSVLTRLVAAESINRPLIGIVYFENGSVRRTILIAEVLSQCIAEKGMPALDTFQAAEHYLALVTHRPRLTTSVGMHHVWDSASTKAHVVSAVECFIRAYPSFA
jgi:TetR/AcrR family transcriptional regulator, mexJK operon transcriptional repressor